MINLIKIFNEEISKFGFIKKNSCWIREVDNIIHVLELQKSSYSSIYYLNVSVYFKEIGVLNKTPKEIDCHIRTRLNKEFIGLSEGFDFLFDSNRTVCSEEVFRELLIKCIKTNVIPQLEFISSKQAINNYLIINPKFLNLLSLKARKYLKLE